MWCVRQTDTLRQRQTQRQTDRQTERQTDRQTDRQSSLACSLYIYLLLSHLPQLKLPGEESHVKADSKLHLRHPNAQKLWAMAGVWQLGLGAIVLVMSQRHRGTLPGLRARTWTEFTGGFNAEFTTEVRAALRELIKRNHNRKLVRERERARAREREHPRFRSVS